jgi:hypothetical protein
MPLSQQERERIIETQTLKAEVESTLTAGKPKPRFSDFTNQIILLVLGFALTTAVGGVLTYYWKQRDWHNQQSYLAQQRALDKKYATIDRTLKEVALTTSAAEDVLWIYYSENLSTKNVNERMDNWHKTSRDWRVQSKVLSASLAANFADPEVNKLFDQIVSKRRFLGNAIMNLPKFDPKMRITPELKKQLEDANDLINQIVDLLQKCGSRMTSEARTYSVSDN